jgi:HD-GYP domain-containing protein (c-di-GMP phosphodiesterase class II)
VEFIAISTILLSLWQLYELHGCFKKDKSYYLRFIYLAIFVQIALLVSRVIVTGLDLSAHASTFDEHQDKFFVRLAYIFCYIVIFIFLGNYFYNHLWKLSISLNQKQEDNMLSILNSLALARDDETGHHILRTQKYVHVLAIRLKSIGFYGAQLDEAYVDILYKAAPLHDIGKVGIPDQILNKPGRLTVEERNIMMTHAAMGASILEVAKDKIENTNDVLSVASTIAESHHEKWDGTGYPAGLKGNAIPLSARIMALADVYDALTAARPYKKAWTHEDASEEIIRNSGIAFDPAVVEAFISEKSYFKEVAEAFYLEERAVSAAIGS